ncbi:hypothetical protein [Glacieibacterium sp.]|uniref:VgrG-related protein n=1 Tax=Glacieibacterium sp. TaxID=2860237 RepID=UPI003AFFA964
MGILPRVDLTARTLVDLRQGVDVDLQLSVGGGGTPEADLAPGTLLAGTSVHVGLDRVLNSASGVDNLLNGPDALARFRATTGAVPSDPSPVADRGMSVRVGDPYSEVATRFAVGSSAVVAPAVRAEIALKAGDATLVARVDGGADSRGVAAVRDPVAATGIAQRIEGPSGATAAARGIAVGAAVTNAGTLTTASVGSRPVAVSFVGLANIFGGLIATPGQAPTGAVVEYRRVDGAMLVELRTTTGFAGSTATSAVPLTGAVEARAGHDVTLTGIYISLAAAASAAGAAAAQPADGRDMPAGHPAGPLEQGSSFGEAERNPDGTDRPYLHAIWYDIMALRFLDAGIRLSDRSAALRDVVWATALEHGPFRDPSGNDILDNIMQVIDPVHASDGDIIAALFAERARRDADGGLVHYPDVQPFDRDRVVERLADEARLAGARTA